MFTRRSVLGGLAGLAAWPRSLFGSPESQKTHPFKIQAKPWFKKLRGQKDQNSPCAVIVSHKIDGVQVYLEGTDQHFVGSLFGRPGATYEVASRPGRVDKRPEAIRQALIGCIKEEMAGSIQSANTILTKMVKAGVVAREHAREILELDVVVGQPVGHPESLVLDPIERDEAPIGYAIKAHGPSIPPAS